MMSNIKSEAVPLTLAVQDRGTLPTPIVKSEFPIHQQPPRATFPCEYCGKEFNLEQYLTCHIVDVHGDSCMRVKLEQVSCRTTNTEPNDHQNCVSRKGHLNSDMLAHTGEKPYRCEFCEKKFRYKGTLKNHLRTHTGSDLKRHSCDICQKEFVHTGSLNRHMLIHTGVNRLVVQFVKRSSHSKE
eukprot:953301_1